MNPQQVKLPDQKPKYRQTTWWLAVTPQILTLGMILLAVFKPDLYKRLNALGFENTINALIAASGVSGGVYIAMEKTKDKATIQSAIQAETHRQQIAAYSPPVIAPLFREGEGEDNA